MRLALLLCLAIPTLAHAQDAALEPFSDTGYVQSCTTDGELPGCMVVGYGIRYVAATDGATDPALLAQLLALPPNSRVDVVGNIISMGDITAEVVLTSVAAAPDAKLDALMAGLQGDWQQTAGAGLQVVGSEWTDIADGQPVNSYLMAVGLPCSDTIPQDKPSVALILMGGDPMDGALCYVIDKIDEKSLTLISVPGREVTTLQRP